ncbi:MAG: cytochrome c oxidase subunit 3 [Fibrobacterales bacterium]
MEFQKEKMMSDHMEHYDEEGTRLGFWLFLFTELFLFGGMFVVYATYRFKYLEDFKIAAGELNTGIGSLNTVILLASSAMIVISLAALKNGDKKLAKRLLIGTWACGAAFLVIKGFEWNAKFGHHLFLQLRTEIDAGHGSPLLNPGAEMLPLGQVVFFGLYFIMTGAHAIHVIIGMIWMTVVYGLIKKDKVRSDHKAGLEFVALYWHLVDLIWIFLFPLYYLIA